MDKLTNFWLVVSENNTGEFKNVDISFTSGATKEDIRPYYKTINPDVTVVSCGEGIENRPFALQGLEYI